MPDPHTEPLDAALAELRRENDRLRAAERRHAEFLALLAHELRNPLSPIRHATAMLARPGLEPADLERLRGVLERQTGHLVRIVEDLTDRSRLGLDRLALQPTRVALAPIVEAAVDSLRREIDAAGLTVELELPPDPLWLQADPARLRQLLAALLHNAVRFSPDGARVRVAASRQPGWLRLVVEDEGCGIEPGWEARIFEPYVQGPTRGRGRPGLGLGLSLVRELVALHGGRVEAGRAGAGSGSRFTVELPLGSEAEPAAA